MKSRLCATWPAFDLFDPLELALDHEHSCRRPVARKNRYQAMADQFLRRKQALESNNSV